MGFNDRRVSELCGEQAGNPWLRVAWLVNSWVINAGTGTPEMRFTALRVAAIRKKLPIGYVDLPKSVPPQTRGLGVTTE